MYRQALVLKAYYGNRTGFMAKFRIGWDFQLAWAYQMAQYEDVRIAQCACFNYDGLLPHVGNMSPDRAATC